LPPPPPKKKKKKNTPTHYAPKKRHTLAYHY
jgi:hypothetical protein